MSFSESAVKAEKKMLSINLRSVEIYQSKLSVIDQWLACVTSILQLSGRIGEQKQA